MYLFEGWCIGEALQLYECEVRRGVLDVTGSACISMYTTMTCSGRCSCDARGIETCPWLPCGLTLRRGACPCMRA